MIGDDLERLTPHDVARAAEIASVAFTHAGWEWTAHVDLDEPYVPSAADIALALASMLRDVRDTDSTYRAIHSGRLRVERVVDEEDGTITTTVLIELAETSEAHAPDQPQVGGA